MSVEQRVTAKLRNGVFLAVAVGDRCEVVVSALDGSGVVMHTNTELETLRP